MLQIEAAYKQKKATSKLLDDQAIEWQQERDEFGQEMKKLKAQLNEREKECIAYGHVVKEVCYHHRFKHIYYVYI